jgi:hypothetical protein
MASALRPDSPELRDGLYRLFREFFSRAERTRRWSLEDDIPWHQVNRGMDPAVADVVESFCAVELYLPDYVGKALPMIRVNRGWSAFHVNWGYWPWATGWNARACAPRDRWPTWPSRSVRTSGSCPTTARRAC